MVKSNSPAAVTYSAAGAASVTPTGTVTITGTGPASLTATQQATTGHTAGSATVNFIAVQASSRTTLTATAVKSGFGVAASLTALVSPQYSGTPTGPVKFHKCGTLLATVAVSGGSANYTTGELTGTQQGFTAICSGNGNFIGSTSNTATLTVPTTSVTLKLASTNLLYPLRPAFEVMVASASGKPEPTGTITTYDGTTVVGAYKLSVQTKGYLLGLVLPPLNVGSHPPTAAYLGDAKLFRVTNEKVGF